MAGGRRQEPESAFEEEAGHERRVEGKCSFWSDGSVAKGEESEGSRASKIFLTCPLADGGKRISILST
ncbi:hypothetical protein MHYP_G00172600 [Metynnis hypsauchen]